MTEEVLIAGAGIGGLTLALTLHRAGIRSRIFEKVGTIQPLGVGINVPPHAARVLHELGLGPALDAGGIQTAEAVYFNRLGQLIWREKRGTAAGYPVPQYSIHRGELQTILHRAVVERLGVDSVVPGHELEAFEQHDGGVTAFFTGEGGQDTRVAAQGSVLVGADGFHSKVRRQLFPNEGAPHFGGRIMYRGVVESDPYLTGRSMVWFGYSAHKFLSYPISAEAASRGRSLINWVAMRKVPDDYVLAPGDWNRQVQRQHVIDQYRGWSYGWYDPSKIIEATEAIYEFPLIDRNPLPAWSHGRVTLLGDAAHPMFPIGSNGAAQAILDAEKLAQLVAASGPTEAALAEYDAIRRPFTAGVVLSNREDGPDRILDLVATRAPQGFSSIDDVIAPEQLAAIARGYKQTAGFELADPLTAFS